MSESLGSRLKKIRETSHLSIEDISERTRIPKKTIALIEDDRIGEIKSAFYSRAFIKSYASFLKATEEPVVKKYLANSEKKDNPVLMLKNEKVAGEWLLKHKRHIGIFLLTLITLFLFIFGLIQVKKIFVYFINSYKSRSIEPENYIKTEPPKPVKEKTIKEILPQTEQENIELNITAVSNTWVKIITDGEMVFSGILTKGSDDSWEAKKEIGLEVGNVKGVSLKLNGENIKIKGRKGKKHSFLINKDGITKQ